MNAHEHAMSEQRKLADECAERARIRRQIPTRKSVQEGAPDRIADLLERCATALLNVQDFSAMADYIEELRQLLRVEFLRHDRLELPWQCKEKDCPRFGKSLYLNGCDCRLDFEREHIAAVRRELGL